MDGFALRAVDTEGGSVRLRITDAIFAGGFASTHVGQGEAMRIMTGAPLPDGADAVVIMTPWPEFRDLDYAAMAQRMNRALLLDPSNLLDARTMVELGFEYVGIGRAAAKRLGAEGGRIDP